MQALPQYPWLEIRTPLTGVPALISTRQINIEWQKGRGMCFVASRTFAGRCLVAAAVVLFWGTRIGSAQLVNVSHPVLGYAHDTYQPFPGTVLAPAFVDARTIALEPEELRYPQPAGTATDRVYPAPESMQKMLQPLPADTEQEVPYGSANAGGIDLGAAYDGIHHAFFRSARQIEDRLPPGTNDDDTGAGEPYHWRGLIAQSLFFNVIENGFRSASDDQIRVLLANKPFWHDYVASIHQFNMRRWNDGDDFLVNYVGHPMQGAVSGFIEVQNDPAGRQQEISATSAYWKSRFKAFLWATVFSTHSEISPLGEAGIGNEGGWTYPIHCRTICTEPGTYKKYTNNTGWVDFTITPTVGTLWLLAEDTLDRFVSDRVQGGNTSRILPKILRGSLNPSRTMANALRFKAPWYRDFQHSPELEASYGVHVLPSDESIEAAKDFRRFAVTPYFLGMPFGTAAHPCAVCMQNPGAGIEADVALTRWIAVSFAISKQQDLMSKGLTTVGSTVSTGLGLRLIHDRPNNTLSLAVRPGIVTEHATISSTLRDNSEPLETTVSHTATTVMLSNDYKFSRFVAWRSSIGINLLRYRNPTRTPPGFGKPPYLSFLSHDSYTNKTTCTLEMGPVFHF